MMFYFCYITPAHNGSVCSILSGWDTTMGRLLGSKDTTMLYCLRSWIKVLQSFDY